MTSDFKGYYSTLGLQPGASIEEVKKAYKKKQVELHPTGPMRRKLRDSPEYKSMTPEQQQAKNAELDEMIAKVNEAFTVLGDEKKKEEYDSGVGQFGDMSGFSGFSGFEGFGNIADIFAHMAGGGRGESRQGKVKDVVCDLQLEIKDVFLGKTSKFRVKTTKICEGCSGKGGKDVTKCGKCKGTGYVMAKFNLGIMTGTQRVECPDCEGKGVSVKGPLCSDCGGKKIIDHSKIIEVTIKPGMRDGESIVYQRQGNEYPGYTQGDIVFNIKVKSTPTSYRVADDYVCTADMDILTALTGGLMYFDHPDGRKMAINVPPFKNFDNVAIVLSGAGFPTKKGRNGNLVIKPHILINSGLNRDELSKILKPLVSNPGGNYGTVNGTLGTVPSPQEDEDDGYSGSSRFGFDHGGFSSFFA